MDTKKSGNSQGERDAGPYGLQAGSSTFTRHLLKISGFFFEKQISEDAPNEFNFKKLNISG
jgi:hypothetical protein